MFRWRRVLGVLVVLGVLASCDDHRVQGDGQVVTQQRHVSPFDRVTVNGNYHVAYSYSPQQSVQVEADRNLLPLIATSVVNGKLIIHKAVDKSVTSTHPVRIKLAGPECVAIHSYGSNVISARGLHGQNFTLKLNGASQVELTGQVESLDVEATGSSGVRADQLAAKQVAVSLRGAGNAEVHADDALSATVGGVGQVMYTGHPRHVVSHVHGLGRLRHT